MASTLGAQAVGSSVKLKENGTLVDYLVVHQGRPSGLYDASCEGTWLLRKDIAETRQWNSAEANDYANSTIQSYLNGTVFNKYDTNIKTAIKQVKIPFRPGAGKGTIISSGANGLSCKVFLLSAYEVGLTQNDNTSIPMDGTKLDYFDDGNVSGSTANQKRIALYNGAAEMWWLRSPITNASYDAWLVNGLGGTSGYGSTRNLLGVRYALVLPTNLLVLGSGSVTVNTAPSAPSSINVPTTVTGGKTLTVTWGTSTDADSNLSGYILERQYNGGSWAQLYKGSARSYTDSITYGWNNVAYRVKAYDSSNAESSYKVSDTRTVFNNTTPTISGSNSDLGTKTGAFNTSYTVTDPDAGQTLTVTEKIDNRVKRTFTATSGTGYSLNVTAAEWRELLNGSHTLTITASDGTASATRTHTFTKNETQISFTLAAPMATDARVTKGIMNMARVIPAGATFKVEVCNNGLDASPAWEDVTGNITGGSKFFLQNTAKTAAGWAFNVRVTVNRGSGVGDCYIQSMGGNFE